MTYIRVRWVHDGGDDPVLIVSELDDARWETRTVEIFADGTKGYANQDTEVGGTALGEMPIPTLSEIAADPQFFPEEITREEFERVWKARDARDPPRSVH
jgi:hypothetical protein